MIHNLDKALELVEPKLRQEDRLDFLVGKTVRVLKSGFKYRVLNTNKDMLLLDGNVLKNINEVQVI